MGSSIPICPLWPVWDIPHVFCKFSKLILLLAVPLSRSIERGTTRNSGKGPGHRQEHFPKKMGNPWQLAWEIPQLAFSQARAVLQDVHAEEGSPSEFWNALPESSRDNLFLVWFAGRAPESAQVLTVPAEAEWSLRWAP